MKKKSNDLLTDKPYYRAVWHRGYENFGVLGPFLFATYDNGWGRYSATVWHEELVVFHKNINLGESLAKNEAWEAAKRLYKEWEAEQIDDLEQESITLWSHMED